MYINETVINILIGFLSALLVLGAFFWWFMQRMHHENRILSYELQEKKEQLQALTLTLATYKERVEQSAHNKQEMRQEFENLAHKILHNNAQSLTKQHTQTLSHIINPFQEHIKSFHERIENYYNFEAKERFSLTKEIHNLQTLNLKISQDAINLTNALKGDNKIQGEWGEVILTRVLESSGLKSGREFLLQKSYKKEKEGHLRPDVIINLPENRQLVIDAKVSLNAYESYMHEKDDKAVHLKAFLHSLKMHIKGLSDKSYEKIAEIETLDFVLLFIPIEGAFMLASHEGRDLFQFAYQKNIILVSPSTLLAVLRVIENTWRIEYQNKNAKIIAKKAGDLYDKFSGFIIEMEKIESALDKASNAYEDAFKKLSTGKGNMLRRAEELKALEGIADIRK